MGVILETDEPTDFGITALGDSTVNWITDTLLVADSALQMGLIILAALVASFLAKPLGASIDAREQAFASNPALKRFAAVIKEVLFPLTWLLTQFLVMFLPAALGFDGSFLVVTTSLISAWVVIRIASTFVSNPGWARIIATCAWAVAALNILGLLDNVIAQLRGMGFAVGEVRLTVMGVVEGVLTLVILLWLTSLAAHLIENRLKASPNLTPSIQVLSAKLLRMALLAFAFFTSLAIVGVDLTALAVFSGAIGVGLGFGLQKIFGNLISGIILLLDKSIKPGDVIAVADYYGRVDSLGARYVAVLTRDGVEHLIPNEDLIVNRVENWTHSQNLLRLRQPLGVHYKSNIHQAMALCLEAARETDRILPDPAPNCLLRGYGDSAVDLEVRFWINDPMNGRANVKSALLIRIWDKFHEHGIEIPYPQRDLHFRSSEIGVDISDLSED